MQLGSAGRHIADVPPEGFAHDRKGNLLPRNRRERTQTNVQAFGSRLKSRRKHPPTEHKIHLPDMRQTEHGMECGNLYVCMSLFLRLTDRRLLGTFTNFHETSRKGPQPTPRFNCASAQKNLPLPFGDTARDDLWIMIMNRLALPTHMPRQIVPTWNLLSDRSAALATVFHGYALPRHVYFVACPTLPHLTKTIGVNSTNARGFPSTAHHTGITAIIIFEVNEPGLDVGPRDVRSGMQRWHPPPLRQHEGPAETRGLPYRFNSPNHPLTIHASTQIMGES